jgi:hypothetical protein
MAGRRILYLVLLAACVWQLGCEAASLEFMFSDDTGGCGYDVVVGNGYAYVSNNVGVSIYDVRDPENVSLLTHPAWTGGAVFGMAIHENTLCMAAPNLGVLVADVSDPAAPVILSRIATNTDAVSLHNGILYVQSRTGPVKVYDIRTPSAPIQLPDLSIRGSTGIAGFGQELYVIDPSRGIVRLDVSDPARPREIGVLRNSGGGYKLEVRGEFLFVARYTNGVCGYDLSGSSTIPQTFSFMHTGEAWDASGEYPIVCVADLQEGVEVLEIPDGGPARMILADSSYAPHSLHYEGGYIHLADQDDVYVLLKLELGEDAD